jgi:hypothetical protein
VLLRASGMTLAEFDGLDAFLAEQPEVERPRPERPDPKAAVSLALEMGLQRDRVLACFC